MDFDTLVEQELDIASGEYTMLTEQELVEALSTSQSGVLGALAGMTVTANQFAGSISDWVMSTGILDNPIMGMAARLFSSTALAHITGVGFASVVVFAIVKHFKNQRTVTKLLSIHYPNMLRDLHEMEKAAKAAEARGAGGSVLTDLNRKSAEFGKQVAKAKVAVMKDESLEKKDRALVERSLDKFVKAQQKEMKKLILKAQKKQAG